MEKARRNSIDKKQNELEQSKNHPPSFAASFLTGGVFECDTLLIEDLWQYGVC